MIPLTLFMRIIELLQFWDSPMHHELRFEYCDILWELKVKIKKLELREAYSKMVAASDDNARHDARIEYLRLKNNLADIDLPDFLF